MTTRTSLSLTLVALFVAACSFTPAALSTPCRCRVTVSEVKPPEEFEEPARWFIAHTQGDCGGIGIVGAPWVVTPEAVLLEHLYPPYVGVVGVPGHYTLRAVYTEGWGEIEFDLP